MATTQVARLALFACCAVIAGVSIHDAMLIIINHETINDDERNPVGRWLLAVQGGEIWLFVLAKLLGTSIVCSVLIVLFARRPQMALIAAVAVACFQLALLAYLTCI